MRIFSDMLSTVHKVLAVPVAVSGQPDPIMMIDKTSGVELEPKPPASVGTVVPAAVVRRSELARYGVTVAQMVGRLVVIDGVTWIVNQTQPLPTPEGISRGEVLLILRKA